MTMKTEPIKGDLLQDINSHRIGRYEGCIKLSNPPFYVVTWIDDRSVGSIWEPCCVFVTESSEEQEKK